MKIISYLILFTLILNSCKEEKLPFLGNKKMENGKEIYPKIRPFKFLNQDSVEVTNATFANGVYIADFFFTHCPSICPKVAKQMLTIYDEFKDNPNVKLVSFSIDPKRDTIGRLKWYANNLEVKSDKWMLLTGDKDFTLDLSYDFYITALEDKDAPGGFDHSGNIVLVDKNGHVRAFCNGTEPSEIPMFVEKVKILLREK